MIKAIKKDLLWVGLVVLLLVIISTSIIVYAAKVSIVPLKGTDGVVWVDKAMTTATGTYYSKTISSNRSFGFSSLLVKTSAGSLAITFEVSDDEANWYTPKDTIGNDLGVISTALTADTWIVFAPQVSKFKRFKFVLTGSDSLVSATYRHCN